MQHSACTICITISELCETSKVLVLYLLLNLPCMCMQHCVCTICTTKAVLCVSLWFHFIYQFTCTVCSNVLALHVPLLLHCMQHCAFTIRSIRGMHAKGMQSKNWDIKDIAALLQLQRFCPVQYKLQQTPQPRLFNGSKMYHTRLYKLN